MILVLKFKSFYGKLGKYYLTAQDSRASLDKTNGNVMEIN